MAREVLIPNVRRWNRRRGLCGRDRRSGVFIVSATPLCIKTRNVPRGHRTIADGIVSRLWVGCAEQHLELSFEELSEGRRSHVVAFSGDVHGGHWLVKVNLDGWIGPKLLQDNSKHSIVGGVVKHLTRECR